jgi:hypothetical protein
MTVCVQDGVNICSKGKKCTISLILKLCVYIHVLGEVHHFKLIEIGKRILRTKKDRPFFLFSSFPKRKRFLEPKN